jgi:subtilase family serine protease
MKNIIITSILLMLCLAAPNCIAGETTPAANSITAFIDKGTGYNQDFSPADILSHYNYPSNLTGEGQTIAIVDLAGFQTAAAVLSDMNTFNAYYGLPICNTANPCLQQISMEGGAVSTSVATLKAGEEIALDIEWAHAVAPAATIVLVTTKTATLDGLMAAVRMAAAQPNVVAISMSWGVTEFSGETGANYDGVLKSIRDSGIVLVASSGDMGNNNPYWPASSPYVLSVGGTTVQGTPSAHPTGNTEIVAPISGGGASLYEAMPSYQTAATIGAAAVALGASKRLYPDVAYNANITYSPFSTYVGGSWVVNGGTSAGSPQWAAIVALIAQNRAQHGQSSLATLLRGTVDGFNAILYQTATQQSGLFDITYGNNNNDAQIPCAICQAGVGYDAVTGLGVPNVAQLLNFF